MRIGRYELKKRLARGGMGEVWLAKHVGPWAGSKPLVVKLLLPHLAEDRAAVESFLAEARLAASMNHPNVVQVFDAGEAEGRFFLVMERVDGVSLSTLIKAVRLSGEKLPLDLWLEVARGLCDGLHHAHELKDESGRALGLVHRDVSPHNLLVSSSGEVKLTDFGIAKISSMGATRSGVVKGKFAYLAPEQAEGRHVDRRADLFAAAVTLFELATGISPFRRETDAASMDAVRRQPLPSLGDHRPDFPATVQAVLECAADKSAARRFSTARELRERLPAPSGTARDGLGELVSRLCSEELVQLQDQSFSRSRGATRATSQVSQPGWRKPAVAGIAAGVLLAGGGWTLWGPRGVLRATPAEPHEAAQPSSASPANPSEAVPLPGLAAPSEVAPPEPEPKRPVPGPNAARPTSPPPSPGPGGSGGSHARPQSAEPRVQGRASLGFLTIDAVPWARVWVGNVPIGETPLAAFPVEEGTVSVRLENPETGRSVVRKVHVRGGETVRLRADLR